MIKEKQLPTKNVFLILALSDLSLSVSCAIHAIADWHLDHCSRHWLANVVLFDMIAISNCANRGVTLYVTLIRAFATTNQKVVAYQSWIRFLLEMTSFIIIGCLPLFIEWTMRPTLKQLSDLRFLFQLYFVHYIFLIIIMVILVMYI